MSVPLLECSFLTTKNGRVAIPLKSFVALKPAWREDEVILVYKERVSGIFWGESDEVRRVTLSLEEGNEITEQLNHFSRVK